LVLVLLTLGTRFRGAGVAGFTNLPAAPPAPQIPVVEPDVQGHSDDPKGDAFEHSEIPQIPTDELEANQDKQESMNPDTDDNAALITAETITENPPMTLPADKLIKEWRPWPESKK